MVLHQAVSSEARNVPSSRQLTHTSHGRRLVEDRSFADNHCLAADPNFLENSCTARE